MNIKKIKVAKKNPRIMGKESRRALVKSLNTFDDISGITVNERTGNVVSGNHRWEELKKIHGEAHLKLSNLIGEFHALEAQGEFTGFIAHPGRSRAGPAGGVRGPRRGLGIFVGGETARSRPGAPVRPRSARRLSPAAGSPRRPAAR